MSGYFNNIIAESQKRLPTVTDGLPGWEQETIIDSASSDVTGSEVPTEHLWEDTQAQSDASDQANLPHAAQQQAQTPIEAADKKVHIENNPVHHTTIADSHLNNTTEAIERPGSVIQDSAAGKPVKPNDKDTHFPHQSELQPTMKARTTGTHERTGQSVFNQSVPVTPSTAQPSSASAIEVSDEKHFHLAQPVPKNAQEEKTTASPSLEINVVNHTDQPRSSATRQQYATTAVEHSGQTPGRESSALISDNSNPAPPVQVSLHIGQITVLVEDVQAKKPIDSVANQSSTAAIDRLFLRSL